MTPAMNALLRRLVLITSAWNRSVLQGELQCCHSVRNNITRHGEDTIVTVVTVLAEMWYNVKQEPARR
jgi:hypothetical protein